MTYLLLDDGFAEHKKVASLTPTAFKLHVTGLCHCARHLTDGHLSVHAVKIISVVMSVRTGKWITELVEAGVWLEDDQGDGYWVKDYLEYNPSADQVKAKKLAAKRAANTRWGNADSNAPGIADGNAERIAPGSASGSAESNAKTHPIPSHSPNSLPLLANPRENGGSKNDHPSAFGTPYFALLHAACGSTDDALTKLRRAARGKPEGAIVNALELAKSPGVRDPLAIALSELAKYGKVTAA